MSEQHFEKMDREWMESTKELREKKVSDGILKGFSASVERRILSKERSPKRAWSPAWAPVMAVMVIAFALTLRLPDRPAGTPFLSTPLPPPAKTVDYAERLDTDTVDDEIAALKEMGAWSDEDEKLLGEGEEANMEDLELSNSMDSQTHIA